MPQYDNTNTGVLFVNNRKEKETHPDRTGTINIEGREYFLDGWLKDGKEGKFLSLRVKLKDKQPPAPAGGYSQRGPGPQPGPDDDGEPFPF